MKKAVLLTLTMAILANLVAFSVLLAVPVNAAESHDLPQYSGQDIGIVSTCRYNDSSKKIEIVGNINHDIMVTHSNYNIAVYSLSYGKTLEEVINDPHSLPVASSAISVKFSFSVSAENIAERFSMYAVVIYDHQGDIKLVDEPKYPDAESEYFFEQGDKTYYKGVSSNLLSVVSDAGASTAIVPVYLDKLVNNGSKGHLYSIEGTYIYFDKDYINEIDVRVKSLSATGCRVYLQFFQLYYSSNGVTTLHPAGEDAYGIPDMSVDKTMTLISGFTDFICERYCNMGNMGIAGIILGSCTDKLYYTDSGISVDDYLLNLTRYMVAVGNIARAENASLDIVLPISDFDSYSSEQDLREDAPDCLPSALLNGISALLDEFFTDGFDFSIMVETSSVPYGISEETLLSKKFSTDGYKNINADRVELLSDFLASMEENYDSAPSSFIFLWSVPENISGNVLSCSYAYSYFRLLPCDRLSAFVVSFEDVEMEGDHTKYPEIANIMKYIDTSESFAVTRQQLDMLGASNWYAIIENMYSGKIDTRRVLEPQILDELPTTVIGSYNYYEFERYTNISSWFAGNLCDLLKVDYNNISGRSLVAHFNAQASSPSEFSEIFCSYDYPENFVYTPYMLVKFSLENDSEDEEALYEVRFVFGSGKNTAEVTRLCSSYEEIALIFDISDFSEVSMADYIKISVRKLTGGDEGYSLALSSVVGYSSEYLSEELEELISEERLRIRDSLDESEEDNNGGKNTVMIVAGVAIVVAFIGVGIFMCFRNDE